MPVCKGDCDADEDCAEGLYCHQRAGNMPVPYCDGGEEEASTADYCTWDGISPPPEFAGPPPEGYFRLKIYWEEGYLWQNETFERKCRDVTALVIETMLIQLTGLNMIAVFSAGEWCMIYDYQGYPGTGLCWLADKDIDCDQDRAFVGKCLDNEPRMWFTFVNVSTSVLVEKSLVDERLIMTGDDQRCLTRYDREIYLEACDASNYRQRWIAMNGDFDGPKFEMSQLGYTHQCITSDHHPKSGEIVETHDCEAARSLESQTSYWERY
jgi:hypothetical protein